MNCSRSQIAMAAARKASQSVSTNVTKDPNTQRFVSSGQNPHRFADASGPIRVGFVSADISGKNGVGRHLSEWSFWERCVRCFPTTDTWHPKFETRHPKPETRNLKLET